MKGTRNFGWKVLAFVSCAAMLAHVGARGFRHPFEYDEPDPVDSPVIAGPKSADSLRFPIADHRNEPGTDSRNTGLDLGDPSNVSRSIDYDPADNRYYLSEKVGDQFIRNPSYMSFEEYQKYSAKQEEQNYWKRRLDALTLFNKKPDLPVMYKEGIFDRIFGGQGISVRPQGNVDVTVGGNWQNIQNPTIVQRAQKYGIFDFDMQMNVNLLAQVGDKLKLNISNNTKATFDYQNVQKLEYTGKEDEIIKKIEAGNVSFPLRSSLIQGVQSLFGLKTQLQFGKLWVTAALSQQKSKRQSITVQGGAQTQTFGIKADDYEENKHFFVGQFFRNNYNSALKNFPVISSQATINKIEVWVTNQTGAIDGVRDVLCFQDLGETTPYRQNFTIPGKQIQPDNRANSLYDELQQRPEFRQTKTATTVAESLFPPSVGGGPGQGSGNGIDFSRTTARKLNTSEFTFNPQLGYISLNTQVNPNDVLGVAYRYTYNGKVYQVGEFAEDLPPDTSNQKVMVLKMLKTQNSNAAYPIWDLMMKNVYLLGGIGVSKEDFRLNVLYQDPGGGEKRYLPSSAAAGVPLITLLNLDRLNFQNDPQPDGVFDYIEGVTVIPQQGRIIFPVLEPFGSDLKPALGGNRQDENKYLYQILYDSTKTIARQFQQKNRFVMRGSYRSASSSEIFLGGFNIPPGSVTVTAGGQKLTENSDYQIDYGLGRLKIINTGILTSGIPINVAYEDNATFGFQQQNFMGLHLDYYANNKLTIGATAMRLTERPFTQKTSFGEDPIQNTVLGTDVAYQSELPGLTRLLDKLPVYSSSSPSFINASAEVATLRPGHPKQINSLDPEGAVYIDDFEGTRSAYDLKYPAAAWSLASVPFGAKDRFGNILFPEAGDRDKLTYGFNRARLAWYLIEPTLIDPIGGTPGYVKNDPNQHYIRLVQQQDVFPAKVLGGGVFNAALSTFDLTFIPTQRGPYNFDVAGTNLDGSLSNPQRRWGGITRPLEYSDFEASNVEYIEFWLMDPFINKPSSSGGTLYLNLGNISEDVLKDGRKTFENGIPYPKDQTKLDRTAWGNVPQFQQQITRAFDNDPTARATQDVGYDGMNNQEEAEFFAQYLADLSARLGAGSPAVAAATTDPSSDDYRYFRDNFYDQSNGYIRNRYLAFNNPQGNSPVADPSASYSSASTIIPESEDIDRDNTLNESEDYYQYRIELTPGSLRVGSNFIVATQTAPNVKMPNGSTEPETWYQFKIPIREYQEKVGNIADFRSIRFMRMFLTGFTDTVTTRFAQLNLGRNQWRRYMFSLKNPGENIPDDERIGTDFTVTSVSLEEHRDRKPIAYTIPPGVQRQLQAVSNGNTIQQNEQALSLQVCGLRDGDARAAYKEVNVDMRQFGRLRMFVHGEAFNNNMLRDGEMAAFIRIGSDFINNYYEYQIPLKATNSGATRPEEIWPLENQVDVALQDLVNAKIARNAARANPLVPYTVVDAAGHNIVVVGNPNVGESKTIMLGVVNPKKDARSPGDDGMPKCAEIWFNELRMTGLNEKPGYAATAKVNLQLADLGTLNAGGSMHTQGYGNIDQKLQQRQRNNFYQYDANTNLALGKLMPRNWGVQLPLFVGYSESISNPQYNPYDLDVTYKDQVRAAGSASERDSLRKVAQDYTSITSVNLNNVRILGNPEKQNAKTMPWSAKNFDLSYAYNRQFKRNPLIEGDELTNHRLGLGYAYSVRSKPLEPFKSLIKSKSKWLALIKDININPLPSTVAFRTEMNRIMDETKVRVIGDGVYEIPSTFYKNFTWLRTYSLRWELTKSLSLDYSATNNSRIDEPYGRIDSKEKRDTLWNAIKRFGRNTLFTQQANVAYNVPFSKLPATDWINLRVGYGATYTWTAASRLAYTLGNTAGNTQSKTVNGELNFTQLYNKNRFLRAANAPRNRSMRKGAQPNGNPARRDQADGPGALSVGGGKGGVERAVEGALEPAGGGGDQQTAANARKQKEDPRPKTLNLRGVVINTVNMSDLQLDSVRKLIREEEVAKAKAEKKKRKADRKAARKKRRATNPQLSPAARTAGQLLTMVKRATISYTESGSTMLPGYMDSTVIFGVNPTGGYPGVDFAFGGQPATSYLDALSRANRLSTDSLFNAQFQQTHSSNLNIAMQVEPIPNDLRIDFSLTKQFTKNHSELYKDTSVDRSRGFTHNNPYETGSFNMTTIALKTLFDRGSGATTRVFQDFVRNRSTISGRLGNLNPYTNGAMNPGSDSFTKGYNRYSQDVLIPAFIAAYSGRSGSSVPLLDYENQSIRSNPFRRYMPLPNWRLNYNGLSRIPAFRNIFNNFTLTNSYTGTISMSSFVSALYYQDIYSLGFPSFLDSNSGNFVPYFQVPNVTISEQFSPVTGIDASLKNNMTLRFEYRRSRVASLSLIDYQISETKSAEFVFGGGYRIKGLKLPFSVFGVRKLDNDLNIKVDIGIRDDITTNTYLAQDLSIVTRGQKVITISPSADYIINDKLTLRFFYDRRRSIPYTTQSYPMSTTRAGLTLRFIFAN